MEVGRGRLLYLSLHCHLSADLLAPVLLVVIRNTRSPLSANAFHRLGVCEV